MGQRVFGIVGFKDNGKTTLLVRLVAHLVGLGLRVSTVKHAHHAVDIDQPGKDSFRHREAGAREVILATSRRWALVHELHDEAEPALADLVARLAPADLVLVEGFKAFPHPKLEVHRAARGTPLLATADPTIVAVATDEPLPTPLPCFPLDDVAAVARFILGQLEVEVHP